MYAKSADWASNSSDGQVTDTYLRLWFCMIEASSVAASRASLAGECALSGSIYMCVCVYFLVMFTNENYSLGTWQFVMQMVSWKVFPTVHWIFTISGAMMVHMRLGKYFFAGWEDPVLSFSTAAYFFLCSPIFEWKDPILFCIRIFFSSLVGAEVEHRALIDQHASPLAKTVNIWDFNPWYWMYL